MEGRLHPLELIFQRVEAESERRAGEDSVMWSRFDQLYGSKERQRARTVSSIRVGEASSNPSLSSYSWSSRTISYSDLPQYEGWQDDGASSFTTQASFEEEDQEDTIVTQIHQIASSPGISKTIDNLFPRRRSRASAIIARPTNMVIGISVEQATDEAKEVTDAATATVRGPENSSCNSPTGRRWASKAKVFKKKFTGKWL